MTIKQAGIHGNDIHKVLCGRPLRKNKYLFFAGCKSGVEGREWGWARENVWSIFLALDMD